ncbi:MAG: hypothetical protein Q7S22_07215 [Candidatus Micrarchaeota archaeon]|nr:hypothetical protein [Candidatus Micrarchaeota archaeon]
MGLSLGWLSKVLDTSKPGDNVLGAKSKGVNLGKSTKLSTADYEVCVPLDWKVFKSNEETGVIILRSSDNTYNMVISPTYYDSTLEQVKIEELFKRSLEVRINAERTSTKNDLVLSDQNVIVNKERIYVKYSGYEKVLLRIFTTFVIAEKGKLIFFYIESIGTNQEIFFNVCDLIVSSINVK